MTLYMSQSVYFGSLLMGPTWDDWAYDLARWCDNFITPNTEEWVFEECDLVSTQVCHLGLVNSSKGPNCSIVFIASFFSFSK